MRLLDGQTIDTTGTQEEFTCRGGSLLIQSDGVFGGATVTIQGKMEDFDYQDLKDESGTVLSMTSADMVVALYCKPGLTIRASLTGATGTTDVSVGVLN